MTMSTRHIDEQVSKLIGRLPKRLSHVFRLLDYLSSPFAWGVYLLLLLVIGADDINVKLTVAVLLAVPVASILKLFFRRQRPPTVYAEAMKIKSYSFPSSHAYTAALGCGYLIGAGLTGGAMAISAVLVALVLVIGISRVHIGAHYPSDVIAGWLLGMAVLSGLLAIASAGGF